MKNKYLVLVLVMFFILLLSINTLAVDLKLNSSSAILVTADTGQVLFSQNPEQKLPGGSIDKIMTLLIAMEHIDEGNIALDEEITISRRAESMGGSQIFLSAGSAVSLEDLLKAIVITGANDASVAVAEAVAGSESEFVKLMNERARELNMDNTSFINCTGLPLNGSENQYTTAADIAKMSRALIEYPQILEWSSINLDYLQLQGREAMLANTNKLINSYHGLDGLRTGYTQQAGYCLVATALRNDYRLVSVVLNADSEENRREDTAKLLNYGFNNFSREKIIESGQLVQNIEIPLAAREYTSAEAGDDFYLYRRGGNEEITRELILKQKLTAPIASGEKIGEWVVKIDSKQIGAVELFAVEDVKKIGFFQQIWRQFIERFTELLEDS